MMVKVLCLSRHKEERPDWSIKAFVLAEPDCNDQKACTRDAWDGTKCTHTLLPAGTVCRTAPRTACDGRRGTCGGK